MTFLNPAVLIGLLAASIPVLIHLLNLRKLKRLDFSTISFLKELQKNKIRKIKLKQWLLLALRVMIILMIVLAFARPALKGTNIGGAGSTAKTTAVFILDDTFSMSVIGSRGSYLNQAKETIKNLLRELQEGDQAALILLSGSDVTEAEVTSNISELSKKVDEVEISYSTNYIHNAVASASKLISESQNFNKEIYILSDFQENRIAAEKSLSDFSEVLNQNVKLYGFNFSGKAVYNVAVTDFTLQTQIFEKDKPVSFDVTLTNYSENDAEDVVLSLFSNGERSSQKSVDIPSGNSVVTSVEANLNQAGYIEYSAEIEDDEVLQDNRRYVSVYIPDELPSLIFFESENDIRFIELALRTAGEGNSLRLSRKNISQISTTNLSAFRTIIVSGSPDKASSERIKIFVQNGGGLIIFPSSEQSPEMLNNFLSYLDIPSSGGTSGQKKGSAVINRFNSIDLEHPLFQNIFQNEKKKVESPEFYYNFRINPSVKGRSIISLSDGSSFLSEYNRGTGRIILFSSLPDLTWTNLPVKGIFAPLMYKSLLYLSFNQKQEEDGLAGSTMNINLRGRAVPQITIYNPDGRSETLNTEGEEYLSYNNTGTAGIYRVSFGDEIINKIVLNTDPAESAIRYISEDDFEDYLKKIGFAGTFVNVDPYGNPASEILQARFGSELWKIFAVITLLLALMEMTIARSAKRDLAVIQ
jgi:hypothetical protein